MVQGSIVFAMTSSVPNDTPIFAYEWLQLPFSPAALGYCPIPYGLPILCLHFVISPIMGKPFSNYPNLNVPSAFLLTH